MYSTCLACGVGFRKNQVLEHLPIGRRVAFDPARGRLWVVCGRCLRWNLVPFEQRWEALEECEIALESARMRVGTDEMLLARHPSGLDLIRVGMPGPLEMATWRWGDRFTERRRRRRVWNTAAAGAVAAGAVGTAVAGGAAALLIGAGAAAYLAPLAAVLWQVNGAGIRVPEDTGGYRLLTIEQVKNSVLRSQDASDGWELEVPPVDHRGSPITLRGAAAERMARRLLSRLNRGGAGTETVEQAVGHLEVSEDPERFIRSLADSTPRWKGLHNNKRDINLALEMALYEDAERQAMEGELSTLEAAWREAEELAAISDQLLISGPVKDRLHQLREGTREDGNAAGK